MAVPPAVSRKYFCFAQVVRITSPASLEIMITIDALNVIQGWADFGAAMAANLAFAEPIPVLLEKLACRAFTYWADHIGHLEPSFQ
jgi:hypothetical protein